MRNPQKASIVEVLGAKAIAADALDQSALREAIQQVEPEVIIHQLTAHGGLVNFKKLDEDFRVTNQLRTEVTTTLCDTARLVGTRRIVAQSFCGWPFAREGSWVKTEADPLDLSPPATSGTVEEIQACGEPRAILLTSKWHVRGAGQWKNSFNVPIIAPSSAKDELAEAGAVADRTVTEGDRVMGWDVLSFESENGEYIELAYWHASTNTLIIGDLFTRNDEGQIVFGPPIFMNVSPAELHPMVERLVSLRPKLLLSAHLGPVEDAMELLTRFIP